MKSVITGATGFIGKALCRRLNAPTALTRNPDRAKSKLPQAGAIFGWNPTAEPPPEEAFEGAEAVFHLAGESVADGRWNDARKAEILNSRVESTRNLVRTLEKLENRPKVFVCASAVGYYGDRGEEKLEESSAPGTGYLSDVCQQWEAAADEATALGIRLVKLRIGVVLGPGGGALSKMLPPFKLGIGGRLGPGTQWMPWIHVEDVVGLLMHCAENPAVSGAVNAVAPNGITNQELTQTLGRILKRPTLFPVPGFMLQLAVGEFASVLLGSQRVLPLVAQQSGYRYQYPDLEGALRSSL